MLRRALTGLSDCVNVCFRAQVLSTSVVYGEKHADLGGEGGMYVQKGEIPSYTLKSQGRSLICGWEVSINPVIMQEDKEMQTVYVSGCSQTNAPAGKGPAPAWSRRPVWGKSDRQAEGQRQTVERNSALQDGEISLPVPKGGRGKE